MKTQCWKSQVDNSFSSWKGEQRTLLLISYPLTCTQIVRVEDCMTCLSPDIGLSVPTGGWDDFFFLTREVQCTEHVHVFLTIILPDVGLGVYKTWKCAASITAFS